MVEAGQLCYLSSHTPTLSVPSIAKQQKLKPARSRIPHLSQFQIMERDKRMRNAKPVNSVLLLLPRRITKSKALSNTAATSSARNSTRIWRVSRLLLFRTKTWVYRLAGSASVEPFFFRGMVVSSSSWVYLLQAAERWRKTVQSKAKTY